MGSVIFYHLIRSSAADMLAVNAQRALEKGWRVMIRGTDPAGLERLDSQLWLAGGDESFLPHGLAGGPADADQPVLLSQGAAVNGARVLALVDGAEASANDLAEMERVWVLFDGADPARVQAARLQWKTVTSAGHVAQYWSDETGRWEMKSESSPPPTDGS